MTTGIIRNILIAILLLAATQVYAQDENAYLRQQVDSLERVIRDLRKRLNSRTTVSSLETSNEGRDWYSRTGYYDSLGDINYMEDVPKPMPDYREVNFMDFPNEDRIRAMFKTFSKAQTSQWGKSLTGSSPTRMHSRDTSATRAPPTRWLFEPPKLQILTYSHQ